MADEPKPAAPLPDPPILAQAVSTLRGAYLASTADPEVTYRLALTIANGQIAVELTEAMTQEAFSKRAVANVTATDS